MIEFNTLKLSPDRKELLIDIAIEDAPYYENMYLKDIYIDTKDTFTSSGPSNKVCYHKNLIKTFRTYRIGDFVIDPEQCYIVQDNDNYIPLSQVDLGSYVVDMIHTDDDGKVDFVGLQSVSYNGITETKDIVLHFGIYRPSYAIEEGDYFVVENKEVHAVGVNLKINVNDILAPIDNNILFIYVEVGGTPSSDTPCGKDNKYDIGVLVDYHPLYQKGLGFLNELSNSCIVPKNFINFILQFNAFKLAINTCNYSLAIKYWNYLFSKFSVNTTNKCGCYGRNN